MSLRRTAALGRVSGAGAIILSMSSTARGWEAAMCGRERVMMSRAELLLISNHFSLGLLGICMSIRMSKNVAPSEYTSACGDAVLSGALYLSSPTVSSGIAVHMAIDRSLADPKSPSTSSSRFLLLLLLLLPLPPPPFPGVPLK